MRNKVRFTVFGILVAIGMALAPSAFARSHWNVGVNFGFPGISIGYAGSHGHYRGHGYGWGGNYGGGYYGHGYGGSYGAYFSSYASPRYYGAAYYGPSYYSPSYYGVSYYSRGPAYASYPVNRVVYYDHRPVRRVHRGERHYGYYDDDDRGYRGDYANRATYYDRGDDYRR